ncbi:hypothetical protein [Aestuariivita sp.]|jgi:hypothetical protein|uniref:hypothetical protein n=1 Tax=Aestuariivita sp. TaxID=1872407 RepID=UPI00216ECD65|nr:hypothetical protein [Aestuariivita sp.]MCE8008084.1 hypothetical protein [Aestuariivita sp.]
MAHLAKVGQTVPGVKELIATKVWEELAGDAAQLEAQAWKGPGRPDIRLDRRTVGAGAMG